MDTLWLWLARAVPSALLASHRCVQVKAAEKVRVCLSGDAADVVPIAEARMRWRGLSSKYYGSGERMDGWTVGRKAGAMMAWFAWASSRQAIKQASSIQRGRWGHASFQNLTCSSPKSFAFHMSTDYTWQHVLLLYSPLLLSVHSLCNTRDPPLLLSVHSFKAPV